MRGMLFFGKKNKQKDIKNPMFILARKYGFSSHCRVLSPRLHSLPTGFATVHQKVAIRLAANRPCSNPYMFLMKYFEMYL